jgi:hypothetical protein
MDYLLRKRHVKTGTFRAPVFFTSQYVQALAHFNTSKL